MSFFSLNEESEWLATEHFMFMSFLQFCEKEGHMVYFWISVIFYS